MSVSSYTIDTKSFPVAKYVVSGFCNYKSTNPQIVADQFQTVLKPTIVRPHRTNQSVSYKIIKNLTKTEYKYDHNCVQFTKTIITTVV